MRVSPDSENSLGGTGLMDVDSHPYLGAELQCSLKWDSSSNTIVQKATQRLAMMRPTLKHSNYQLAK